jgi:hypothetical protein
LAERSEPIIRRSMFDVQIYFIDPDPDPDFDFDFDLHRLGFGIDLLFLNAV